MSKFNQIDIETSTEVAEDTITAISNWLTVQSESQCEKCSNAFDDWSLKTNISFRLPNNCQLGKGASIMIYLFGGLSSSIWKKIFTIRLVSENKTII